MEWREKSHPALVTKLSLYRMLWFGILNWKRIKDIKLILFSVMLMALILNICHMHLFLSPLSWVCVISQPSPAQPSPAQPARRRNPTFCWSCYNCLQTASQLNLRHLIVDDRYSLFESYMYRCILYTTSIICDIFVTLSNNINNTNYSIVTDNLGCRKLQFLIWIFNKQTERFRFA